MARGGARVALIGLAVAATARGECESDADCYGGKCKFSGPAKAQRTAQGDSRAGTCVCPPLWDQPNCQTLRLKPARASAPGLLLQQTSTWGGTAVQDKDGLYHMFAARMEAHCGLHSWHNTVNGVQVANSDIVRATARTPDGPYTLAETILNTFAHGPQVSVLPNGKLLLAHLGCGNRTLPLLKGCTNGTTPAAATTKDASTTLYMRPKGLSNCDWPAWTGVLQQKSLAQASGWVQLANWSGPGLVVARGPDSWHQNTSINATHADNPSFWPLKNGSVLLAYANKLTNNPPGGHKHIGLAVGTLPVDGESLQPFHDISQEPIFPYEAEDPTIWLDTTNTLTDMRWHIFAHRLVSNISTEVCAHAVASNPYGPWKVASSPAYTKNITWMVDGTSSTTVTVSSGRERPHVIFDRAGKPVALSTGVTPGHIATPVTPGGHTGDFSYTHVQMLDPAQAEV